MDDINPNPEAEETEISTSTDIITEMVTGIPTPVKKNAIKAFGQLCTAAVDIPVAYLEGKAKEIRAGTNARVNLISSGSEQIAEQMDVPSEYVDAANNKFAKKIIQEQINVDKIAQNAQQELQQESPVEPTPSTEDEISTDWLNSFEKEASTKSSEEMQLLFGKILAGEIKNPSTYSIRTVKILAQLDNEIALLFQKFCSLCIALQNNENPNTPLMCHLISLGVDPGRNNLKDYGFNLYNLNLLVEYGLIEPKFHSGIPAAEYLKGILFNFNGELSIFRKINEKDVAQSTSLNGPSLSKAGRELFNIVDKVPDIKYTSALKEFLNNQGLEIIQLQSKC